MTVIQIFFTSLLFFAAASSAAEQKAALRGNGDHEETAVQRTEMGSDGKNFDAMVLPRGLRRQLKDVVDMGNNPVHRLGLCEGDCDSDNDCLVGLKCYQRDGWDPLPPGCSGTKTFDHDYCYSPDPPRQQCSGAKRIRIYKFCINGDADAGEHGEHQLRLDGNLYYPKKWDDCDQDPEGWCKWKEGQCHNLQSGAGWYHIDRKNSITVGQEERDKDIFGNGQNDSDSVVLSAKEWYNPTCETYEIKVAREWRGEKKKTVCWSGGVSVVGSAGAVSGEISGGVQTCSNWTEPPESYIWLITVQAL